MLRLKKILEDFDSDICRDRNDCSKNKWIELLNKGEKEEIKNNLYVLIDNSYGKMGGHVRIQNPEDILDPELIHWEVVDLSDDNPEGDVDAVIFGKKTPFGIKISGMGHDGNKYSKSQLVMQLYRQLNKIGYWVEASGKFAENMLKIKTPYIDNQQDVEKIFNQKVKWLNDKGWYNRKIDNNILKEIILGKPKI